MAQQAPRRPGLEAGPVDAVDHRHRAAITEGGVRKKMDELLAQAREQIKASS